MLKLRNLNVAFESVVLEDAKICIPEHAVALIRGVSGSGKSSILYRLGLISEDTVCIYEEDGCDLLRVSEAERCAFRKNRLGFVLQELCLFEQYDVLGNLKLYAGFHNQKHSLEEYREFLQSVSLTVPLDQPVQTLSSGERQRLAAACCLCKNTDILILDEPTSFLDGKNEKELFRVLRTIADKYGKTVIIASHSPHAEEIADTIFEIRDKKIVEIKHFAEESYTPEQKEEKNSLPLTFYMSYIRYFFRKYRIYETLIILTVTLCLLCMCGMILYTDYSAKKGIEAFQSMSSNQIFVTADKKAVTVDSPLAPFSFELNNPNVSVDPYYRIFAEVEGMVFAVTPLYENDAVQEKTAVSFSESGLYLSFFCYQTLSQMHLDPSKVSTRLFTVSESGDRTYYGNDLKTGGVLQNTYRSPYMENERTGYVCCDYRILQDAYKQCGIELNEKPAGYTLITETFEEYTSILEKLESEEYGFIGFFQYIDEIRDLESLSEQNRILITAAGVLAVFAVLVLLETAYFRKRSAEVILLKINGASSYQIVCILWGDMMAHICAAFLTAFLINRGILYAFRIGAGITEQALLSLFLFLSLILLCLTRIYVHGISAERILRS